ncbi:hypothetical protein SEA_BANTAM_44 [Gordonia phage Bantam]|uniref:Uncharacterized protein n=1 Tax=Gordonia phage Bantam TaxID=1887641 RepID=A0A1B3AYB3_9CAUD|nr:hypothetical protein BIZ77_gp134 [Gordonia phage Bantam]AOE43734.1 hypothetical protein SEA_BANTAM_44 [Gordonia phage Bantam]
MPEAQRRNIEDLSAPEIYAGFEAVLTWMDAAGRIVSMLDGFGENQPAERIEAVLDRLNTVINNAVEGVPNSTPIKDAKAPVLVSDGREHDIVVDLMARRGPSA